MDCEALDFLFGNKVSLGYENNGLNEKVEKCKVYYKFNEGVVTCAPLYLLALTTLFSYCYEGSKILIATVF